MPTKVYGASDDLIEFDGDVYGEVGFWNSGDEPKPAMLVCSDGTIATIRYGDQSGRGIWKIETIAQGSLFDGIETCSDEEARPHSDVMTFRDGLKWAYAATEFERVK